MTKEKVPVSERALFQRINRKIGHENQKLFTARYYPGGYEDSNMGRYYVVDVTRNEVVDTHVDMESYGRDLGVLAEWEALKGQER